PQPGGTAQRAGVCAPARRGQPRRGLAASRGHGRGAPVLGRRSAARRSRGVPRKGAERRRPLDRERPCGHRGRHACRLRPGLETPPEWLPDGVTPKQVTEGLRPLLERPVEHVLATHGGPTDRAALERALPWPRFGGLSLLGRVTPHTP